MTDDPAEIGGQDSLLHPLDELALIPPGLVPDPMVMVQFITGVDGAGGIWHAIDRQRAHYPWTRAASGVAVAVCGALARVTNHGVYDRPGPPVTYGPCHVCAWTVAIATGSTERELQLITPSDRSAAGLARAGVDPLLAVKICRAVLVRESCLAAENGLDHAATVQVLAHAATHRPVLVVPEDCAEDDRCCRHQPAAAEETWRCDYPDGAALCFACTLRAGPWAGSWEGDVMDECRIAAPCGVLQALARHYGITGGSPS